ncbi:PAS domain S-box protein [Natronolimnohabitans innermongolicus]|uniref:histidine kinase n=1 Tax=Natronolimnohabitans innermongolicus JCM 12255 TaxID=1227499 RepID=L9WVZ9_9EURY|nr:PAS domain S-box protein [Natronolimnohabitans innermongolicus]ELY53630.1 multi-sensor signal transduction histidine kinase [Natronolimnohabitans innermongolicus JCM 12255]
MSSGITVLCVDDDPDIRSLTATTLERANDAFTVETAGGGREALARLSDGTAAGGPAVDCVVSDYEMPDVDGLEVLEAVRERDPELPFVLFTGRGSEEIASEAISAGVTDYLQKDLGRDQFAVLANRIENAVEKRRAERARRESERELERYRTLVESVDDPMYVLDEKGRCTIANEALSELLDVDRDALVGEHISSFISRASFERGTKTVRHRYNGDRESDRFEFTLEDDGERWVGEASVTALTDDDGEFAGSTAVIRDITARKRRERELAQYERIIELAPIALFVLDENGAITWMNDEFAAPFDETPDELLGMRFPTLVDRGYYDESVLTKYTDEVRALLSSETDQERAKYHVRFRTSDGELLDHDVHTKLLPLEDGSFTGTIHAIRDTTQRRRYQRELERQNERLEEFTSVVSHDLRNPLNVATGRLELHTEECTTSVPADAERDSLEQVRRSLDRMDELIDHLLSLARHGRLVGDPEPIDLSRVVRRAWGAVDTGDATLECSLEGAIEADEPRLRQLFENLFRNSVEHGSVAPDVRATSSSRPPSSRPPEWTEGEAGATDEASEPTTGGLRVTVGRLPDGFYVEDDGDGLPEGALEGLFDRTVPGDGDRPGLGLQIVEQIATAHDWTIDARNGSGGGARFEVTGVDLLE